MRSNRANRIVCAYNERGIWHLGTIDTASGRLEKIETPYTELSYVRAAPGRAFFRAGSRTEPFSLSSFDLSTREAKVYQRQTNIQIDPDYYSHSGADRVPH